ncbi:CHAD domain-containing protein [Noviluteimonas gilva]|uniref:CHAD domain-containing protein n=1 Tax=Noviluteimonas gilva TaxID=2682097 RepID=A0A7C9LNE6_9GAMM|nr:CHAD domain-containing protein [Lysobacter gilvus]MUV15764.1 CHAD domain-containing protein [Lysobacter gilvus]
MRDTPPHGPGIALRDYGLAELANAIDDLARRGRDLHDGIHQARKAIRRTRALLALGQPLLGPGVKLIDRELRAVNRRLSPLRDAHALVQTFDRLRTKARDEATRTALAGARRIAARQRAAMAKDPAFAVRLRHEQAIVATMRAALTGLPWESLSIASVTDAMAATARKASTARERAFASDDADAWHQWRRRMRRLSQQHRAASAAGLAVPDGFDKHVTEQLGVLQDLSLLIAQCDKHAAFPAYRSVLRRFAKRTLARQRKRLRSVVDAALSTAP